MYVRTHACATSPLCTLLDSQMPHMKQNACVCEPKTHAWATLQNACVSDPVTAGTPCPVVSSCWGSLSTNGATTWPISQALGKSRTASWLGNASSKPQFNQQLATLQCPANLGHLGPVLHLSSCVLLLRSCQAAFVLTRAGRKPDVATGGFQECVPPSAGATISQHFDLNSAGKAAQGTKKT